MMVITANLFSQVKIIRVQFLMVIPLVVVLVVASYPDRFVHLSDLS